MNEPAYPFFTSDTGAKTGLTKLEYFAGLAMQGMLANPKTNMYHNQTHCLALEKAKELIEALDREALK